MSKKSVIVFSSVMLTALLIRFWGIWFDLPYLYSTEEYKTVNYALKMGGGDLNPHFFNYPSLYLYFTLSISGVYFIFGKLAGFFSNSHAFALSFIKNPTNIYLILRFVSVLWSTAIVALMYFLGLKMRSHKTGIFAVLMLSFIPSIIQSSHLIQPALPSAFLVLVSFYFLIDYLSRDNDKSFYFACIFSGLAITTFYNAIPLIVLIPVAYWIKNKRIKLSVSLLAGVFLIVLFFIIGTPYSILDYKTFLNDFSGHSVGLHKNPLDGMIPVFLHYLFIGNKGHVSANTGIPIIGLLCFIGVFNIVFCGNERKKQGNLLILSALILFTIPVIFYHNSGPGYLFPVFPLFILAGAQFLDTISNSKYNKLITGVFILALLPSIIFCLKLDYAYTRKDSRTIAKEWVESNIPSGSKILIDMYPNCPPIKETKTQLTRLYNKAVELNHYKKEYLKLQLEAYPVSDKITGYEIFRILRPANEVSGTIEMVKEAEKVQDLIDISNGFSYLRKSGIKYIIADSADESSGLVSKDKALIYFYTNLPKQGKLIKKFYPENRLSPGPVISIYKLI